MDKQKLNKEVLDILEKHKVGTLATVVDNKPLSRYMTFFNDELMLYTPTNKNTHKAKEIDENPNVHILLGYEGEGYGDSYIEFEGKASISEDQELKDKIWNDHMKNWFDGPNDPNYIVLAIKPNKIRLMNSEHESPQTLEV
ncbi:pyridoxamine 5'-phosphate oxidase family protein [Metabacillus idriensis]|uniref:General stress protein n=1 Tax=Metabacillus idriensis TaxID=324768 RepID=A0A6I2M5D6_9BACI|nr:pyridoxamine 5'-phosphate oxidase family protein [Metabacillus idriensis]MCM3594839.1 pyridoxamine 5'-phosphate oxidase family protein [Metabacillus idriensis]MRX53139.1 general stress protein [Metabacillus idriensis]OHR66181.1 general stress protein [Bacillus sp. HMSC76G11]